MTDLILYIDTDAERRRVVIRAPFPEDVLTDRRVKRRITRICGKNAEVANRVTARTGNLCICAAGTAEDWEIDIGIRGLA